MNSVLVLVFSVTPCIGEVVYCISLTNSNLLVVGAVHLCHQQQQDSSSKCSRCAVAHSSAADTATIGSPEAECSILCMLMTGLGSALYCLLMTGLGSALYYC